MEFRDKLTKRELVTQDNVKLWQQKINSSSGDVKFVRRGTKNVYFKRRTNRFVLREGDEIFRRLKNGDLVLVNRQPTLTITNIMCHRVILQDCRTISLNSVIVGAYGGDFDGDEANVYNIQSAQGEREAWSRCRVALFMYDSGGILRYKPIQDFAYGLYAIEEKYQIDGLYRIWRKNPDNALDVLFAMQQKCERFSCGELTVSYMDPGWYTKMVDAKSKGSRDNLISLREVYSPGISNLVEEGKKSRNSVAVKGLQTKVVGELQRYFRFLMVGIHSIEGVVHDQWGGRLFGLDEIDLPEGLRNCQIGSICALEILEPLMQSTLDAVHRVGDQDSSVPLGRYKPIICANYGSREHFIYTVGGLLKCSKICLKILSECLVETKKGGVALKVRSYYSGHPLTLAAQSRAFAGLMKNSKSEDQDDCVDCLDTYFSKLMWGKFDEFPRENYDDVGRYEPCRNPRGVWSGVRFIRRFCVKELLDVGIDEYGFTFEQARMHVERNTIVRCWTVKVLRNSSILPDKEIARYIEQIPVNFLSYLVDTELTYRVVLGAGLQRYKDILPEKLLLPLLINSPLMAINEGEEVELYITTSWGFGKDHSKYIPMIDIKETGGKFIITDLQKEYVD